MTAPEAGVRATSSHARHARVGLVSLAWLAASVSAWSWACTSPRDDPATSAPGPSGTATGHASSSAKLPADAGDAPSAPPRSSAEASARGCGAALRGYVPVGAGRRALVRSPALAAPAPAVLVLHGYTGSPERIEQTSGWTEFLAGRQALVAYPEGTPTRPEGFGWDTGTSRFSTHGQDDVAYLAALVRRLVEAHCVDPGRILVTGESNGGAMTLLAACDPRTAGAFALAAPVIPAIDDGTLARCGTGPALRLLAIAGRHDRTVTYDGSYRPGLRPLLGQEAWFLRVAAERNGCAPAEPERTPLDDGTRIAPRGCRAPLALVAVDDGVHTWPGGPTGTAGLPPGRFPATSFLWREAGLER